MIKQIAAAAALAILSSTAVAADRAPIYVGADFGTTKIDNVDDRSSSYGIFAGYQLSPQFAIEAGFRRLADYDLRVGTANGDVTLDQTALSVIGTLPLSSGFNVYGRLGYNHLKAKASLAGFGGSDSESGVLYGIGLGYTFSDTVSGRVEIQRPSSDSSNLSAGISFAF